MSDIISQLEAARDSLTPETWTKGTYFDRRTLEPSNHITCFCAHGALHLQVNPDLKKAYLNNESTQQLRRMMRGDPIKIASSAYYRLDPLDLLSIDQCREVWLCRRGEEAHYLLGMVGLTANFNDRVSTTLDMVKTKFDEAIALAKRLEL
jgi:hypothetical protein